MTRTSSEVYVNVNSNNKTLTSLIQGVRGVTTTRDKARKIGNTGKNPEKWVETTVFTGAEDNMMTEDERDTRGKNHRTQRAISVGGKNYPPLPLVM